MIEILNFMKERKKESKNQSSVFSFRDKTLESIETSEMKIYKGVFQFFLFPSKIKFQTIIMGTIIVSPVLL